MERATSLLFREGKEDKTAQALERKRQGGTAELAAGDYQATVARVAALWRERIEANRDDPSFRLTVSAPTNADTRAIATAIREQKRDMGALGPDLATATAQDQNGTGYELALAEGDRVRLFDRVGAAFAGGTHGNIGNNGTVLEVRRLDDEGLGLRNAAGREGTVKWETLSDPRTNRVRLGHGDVLTIDATQGLTSSEHINAMPGGTRAVTGFKAYVAESRHRRQTWLVRIGRRRAPRGGEPQAARRYAAGAGGGWVGEHGPQSLPSAGKGERAGLPGAGPEPAPRRRALQRGLQPGFETQARPHLVERLARIGAALRDGIRNGVGRVRGAARRMDTTAEAPQARQNATQKRSRRLRL